MSKPEQEPLPSARPAAEPDAVKSLSPTQRALVAMERMQAKLASLERVRTEPIAIVGLGCRFPGGAADPEAFWQALRDGVDAVREVPPERWRADAIPNAPPATRWAAMLAEIDGLDAAFFGISPREAASMDPQQRLLLEVSWEALEHAGQAPDRLMGSRTGVFLGVASHDYQEKVAAPGTESVDGYGFTGTLVSVAAGRVSYVLGLKGPCLVVDTACSSSLVAVHMACQSLRSGESDLALAGGVNVLLSSVTTLMLAHMQALSPDGRCKTFDAGANGFVRAEGCGVVVLKRLSDAARDRDRIWALVRGSAVNQDGRSTGLTAPNVLSQQALLRQALENARVSPGQVGLIEAHGTGTSLGDPIELEALQEVLGAPREDGSACVLGSVKTNVGHLEAAAGVAGLIKVVLSMEHEIIPRHLHFQSLNPRISLEGTPFVIPAEERPWPRGSSPRIAGVSSFGISGTNAHVVLSDAPRDAEPVPTRDAAIALLPLSAKQPEALAAAAAATRTWLLDTSERVVDIASTASLRRSHHDHRLAVVGASRGEWAASLAAFLRGEPPKGVAQGRAAPGERPKVAFVFPGQGSQWVGMGRELLATEPVFRAAIESCDRVIRREAGYSLLSVLLSGGDQGELERIDIVQPTLFAVAVGLAALWRSWGIEPDAVVGHSMGEVAAAHVAGALSLEDAAAVICRRSKLARRERGKGAMAVVELSMEEAEQALVGVDDRLSVAASNSRRSTVISGDPAALEDVLSRLERAQVFCRRVNVDFASHSPQMDPLLGELRGLLAGLSPVAAGVPMVSTVTGERIAGEELVAEYWIRNLRQPVRFTQAVARLIESGHALFVEMSPHPILVSAIEDAFAQRDLDGVAASSLRRDQPERRALLESLGALYARGCSPAWGRLHPAGGRVVALPTYRWQRERHWVDGLAEGASAGAGARPSRAAPTPMRRSGGGHPLIGAAFAISTQPEAHVWERALGVAALPYLADHRVRGEAIVPAAAYVEMVLAAADEVLGAGAHVVEDLSFEQMLGLPAEGERVVQVVFRGGEPGRAAFQISSRDGDAWVMHAAGRVARAEGGGAPAIAQETPEQLKQRCPRAVARAEFYQRMERRGLAYGPRFQGVEEVFIGAGEVLGRVRLPEGAAAEADAYLVHPALLDSCLQVLAHLFAAPEAAAGEDTVVPVALERLSVRTRPGQELWVQGRLREEGGSAGALRGDVVLRDDRGEVLAEVHGLQVRRLGPARRAGEDLSDAWLYRLAWRPKAPLAVAPPAASPGGAWLLFTDRGETGAGLSSLLAARGESCIRVVASDRYERVDPCVYRLPPADPGAYRALLREAFGKDVACRGVIHLWSLDAAAPLATTIETLDADQRLGSLSVLSLSQALVQHGFRDTPPLWLVTRGAISVGDDKGDVAIAQAPLWGLCRTLVLEHPGLVCTRIDVSPQRAPDEATLLLREISAPDGEDQVALREHGRYAARLVRCAESEDARSDEPARALAPARGRPFRLGTTAPGVLSRMSLSQVERRPPGPGEVEIEVEVAGLNFIDVMKALGIYPGLPEGPVVLGSECAGRIVGVGEGVEGLALGDEVIAISSGSIASHVTAPALFVVRKPAPMSFDQAATTALVFMTAHYALQHLGRVRPGERVLIHAAAGGTGLAAVQIAQAMGAEVFATAGSEEKREYLRSLGVAHPMDSRSLAFADEVMRRTHGAGVDVVLNSLSGDAIQKSLDALGPYGRFVELGKRDIYQNTRLGLSPFRKSLLYVSVDLAGMMTDRPAMFGAILREVMTLFEQGAYRPLPSQVFPASRTEEAFHHMAQAKHIGKVAIGMRDPEVRIAAAGGAGRPQLDPDASYLITGGLGGLGLSLARWMVDHGARHLALVGRRGPSDEARRALRDVRSAGAEVLVVRADVARRDDVIAALSMVKERLPPLRGVVHAAAILDDRTALELDAERFTTVMAPKMHGAWNLHALTLEQPLDFFVLYSSAASLIGSPGQANYTAANAFLDALAHHRRGTGRPAMSVNWGAFSDVGLAAAQEIRGARLAYRGLESFTPEEGNRALGRLLSKDLPQVGVLKLDLRQWIEFHVSAGQSPLWSELLKEQRSANQGVAPATGIREALLRAAPGARPSLLEQFLREQLGRVIRLDPARIDRMTPFTNLGVDSLMGLELRNRLESGLGLRLSATLLFAYPTTAALVEHLLGRIDPPAKPEREPAPPPGEPPAAKERPSEAVALSALEAGLERLSDDMLARLGEALMDERGW